MNALLGLGLLGLNVWFVMGQAAVTFWLIVLLATVFLDKGQNREAKIELQRYLELYPKGPFAHEVRELLGR